jgi:hypothetical protein
MTSIFIGGFNNTPSQVHGIITQNNNRGFHGSYGEKSANTHTCTAKENYERFKIVWSRVTVFFLIYYFR